MVDRRRRVRAFPVKLPSGARYWTVLDDDLAVVADAGLGTINAVRTSLDALGALAARTIVHLNRYDDAEDLHRRNRTWLAERDGSTTTVDVGALADAVAQGPGPPERPGPVSPGGS